MLESCRDWFGRPHDNWHQAVSRTSTEEILKLKLTKIRRCAFPRTVSEPIDIADTVFNVFSAFPHSDERLVFNGLVRTATRGKIDNEHCSFFELNLPQWFEDSVFISGFDNHISSPRDLPFDGCSIVSDEILAQDSELLFGANSARSLRMTAGTIPHFRPPRGQFGRSIVGVSGPLTQPEPTVPAIAIFVAVQSVPVLSSAAS